jgi:hypothetical protein
VPGRDIFVQAWYQGGISVMDFTDSANPIEIAFFDRGPIDARTMIGGGFWSAYWYGGRIYGTEIVRGLDVFELKPSDYLSENEIAAAREADLGGVFNPQQQFPVTWPDSPAVARAYVDQLERDGVVAPEMVSDLSRALNRAESRIEDGRSDAELATGIDALASGLRAPDGNALGTRRVEALSGVLSAIARQLR